MPTAPSSDVRLVLDTNTAISGLIWGGPPGALIDRARKGTIQLFSSMPLIAELQGVLGRDKFAVALQQRGVSIADLFHGYAALVQVVDPMPIDPTILRDPDDDLVLATALAARADVIVSGDKDLTDLGRFHGIPIITAAAAQTLLPPGSDAGADNDEPINRR